MVCHCSLLSSGILHRNKKATAIGDTPRLFESDKDFDLVESRHKEALWVVTLVKAHIVQNIESLAKGCAESRRVCIVIG